MVERVGCGRFKGWVDGEGRQTVKVKQGRKKKGFHQSRGKRRLHKARVSPTWAFPRRAHKGKKEVISLNHIDLID